MKSSSSAASPAVTQAQDDIQALNLQYNGLCDECDALDITKGNLEAEVRALSEQHADLLRLRDTIPTDVLGAATTELKTVRDAIDLETHNLQQTQDRHQKLAQACAQLADEHTGLVQQLPGVLADLEEARTTLAHVQHERSDHEEQCCALQAANVRRNAEFATENEACNERQDNLQQEVACLENNMKIAQDKKCAIEQELLELSETAAQRAISNAHALQKTQEQLQTIQTKIAASESEYIEAVQHRATQSLHAREDAHNEHELASARESALLQDLITTQQARQSEHDVKLGAMQVQMDISQVQLAERVAAKTEMDASLVALETMIEQTQCDHDEQQNALREIISAHETRKDRNNAEHQTLTEQLDSVHEQLSGYALSVVEKEAELIALEDALLKLRSDRIRHDDTVGQQLGQELTSAREELELCTFAVSGKQTERASLEEDLVRLRNVYALQKEKMQEETDGRGEQTCAELGRHASLVLENQAELAALQDDLVRLRGVCVLEQAQMQEQLALARAQLDTCSCAISEKQTELAGLEDDLLQISGNMEREMVEINTQKTIQLAGVSAAMLEKQGEFDALAIEVHQMRSDLDAEKTLTHAQFGIQKAEYQLVLDTAQADLMQLETTLQQTRTDLDLETGLQTQSAVELDSLRHQLARQNSVLAEQQDEFARLDADLLRVTNELDERSMMLAALPLPHLVGSTASSDTADTGELCNPIAASTQLGYETVLQDI